jgi:hypothetical protein
MPRAATELIGMTSAVTTSNLDWTIARITNPSDSPKGDSPRGLSWSRRRWPHHAPRRCHVVPRSPALRRELSTGRARHQQLNQAPGDPVGSPDGLMRSGIPPRFRPKMPPASKRSAAAGAVQRLRARTAARVFVQTARGLPVVHWPTRRGLRGSSRRRGSSTSSGAAVGAHVPQARPLRVGAGFATRKSISTPRFLTGLSPLRRLSLDVVVMRYARCCWCGEPIAPPTSLRP